MSVTRGCFTIKYAWGAGTKKYPRPSPMGWSGLTINMYEENRSGLEKVFNLIGWKPSLTINTCEEARVG